MARINPDFQPRNLRYPRFSCLFAVVRSRFLIRVIPRLAYILSRCAAGPATGHRLQSVATARFPARSRALDIARLAPGKSARPAAAARSLDTTGRELAELPRPIEMF